MPGFQRSKEALSNIAIELSRRGHVVALIDPYAQGMSSSSTSRLAATTQGYGMFALVEYAYEGNIPYIDINKIGIESDDKDLGKFHGELISEVTTKLGLSNGWFCPSIYCESFSKKGIQNDKYLEGVSETINNDCLLYTSPSPRDRTRSRMPSSA